MGSPILRSGVDLVEISRIENLNPAIRQRFLQRVFTEAELHLIHNRWESVAGRFAAKEAVMKALGCGIGSVGWKEIEILRADNGEPVLELHGTALQWAGEKRLTTWSISISHSRSHAVAVAVATGISADA